MTDMKFRDEFRKVFVAEIRPGTTTDEGIEEILEELRSFCRKDWPRGTKIVVLVSDPTIRHMNGLLGEPLMVRSAPTSFVFSPEEAE